MAHAQERNHEKRSRLLFRQTWMDGGKKHNIKPTRLLENWTLNMIEFSNIIGAQQD